MDVSEYNEEEFISKRLELIEEFEDDLMSIAMKIINLTIGMTKEAFDFWNRMIRPQVCYEFGYIIPETLDKDDIPIGLLCNTCFYHFGLEMADKTYSQSKNKDTFILSDFAGFNLRSDCFSLRKHKVYEVANSYNRLYKAGQGNASLRALALKSELAEWMGKQYEQRVCTIDQADIQLHMKDYDGCTVTCRNAFRNFGSKSTDSCKILLIMLRLSIAKKSLLSSIEDIFQMASSLIFYNFGAYHPLHCTVRSLMAYVCLTAATTTFRSIAQRKPLCSCRRVSRYPATCLAESIPSLRR